MNAINDIQSPNRELSRPTPRRRMFNLAPACAVLTVAIAAGGVAGCDSPFKAASYIEGPRVVGARVSVDAEPGRAWVKPGEPATVTWLTVAREDATPLQWSFVLCLGAHDVCDGAPLATLSGQGPTATVSFTTPDQATLGPTLSPILMGAICADGELSFNAATMMPVCVGMGASITNATLVVPVQLGADTDHHPNLGDDRIQLGDADWTATTTKAAGDPCDATSGLPIVTAGKQNIRLVSDANDRETYLKGDPAVATLEELQISQFATAGKFKFAYSDIAATDTRADADAAIAWDPPAATEVPAGGLTVQFHFVARDLRGGIDWTHRALCVLAP